MARFDDWTVGTATAHGKITSVFHKNPDFIIYELDNSGWFVFDSVGDIGRQFSAIQTEWTSVTNLLNSSRERSKYRGKLSGALKECLIGNIIAAKEKLDVVKESIIDYKTTIGQIEYLSGTFIAVILFSVILLSISYFTEINHTTLKIIFSGILGGILSVSFNIKSIYINTHSGDVIIHLILGATRIVISAISSFIIYILIKGGFLLGIMHGSNNYVFYALGAISGFSEAFIPNLLKKVKDNNLRIKK
jgi:hypothetical protein